MNIITGTPWYVWGILAYLVFLGITSTKTKVVSLPRLFIIPLIVTAMKHKVLFSEDAVVFCLVIVISSIASFFIHAGDKIKVIKKRAFNPSSGGGYGTLFILISFFIVKYYFGYIRATDPELFLQYALVEHITTGLFSGYFIGRAICYARTYFQD